MLPALSIVKCGLLPKRLLQKSASIRFKLLSSVSCITIVSIGDPGGLTSPLGLGRWSILGRGVVALTGAAVSASANKA